MESILLALALATCAESPEKCTFTELSNTTLVTACGLAPEEQGSPINIRTIIQGERYDIILEPDCREV